MTYTVKLLNSKNNWVIENVQTPDLAAALSLKSKWFREFHGFDASDLDQLRPDRVRLPVRVTIESAA